MLNFVAYEYDTGKVEKWSRVVMDNDLSFLLREMSFLFCA